MKNNFIHLFIVSFQQLLIYHLTFFAKNNNFKKLTNAFAISKCFWPKLTRMRRDFIFCLSEVPSNMNIIVVLPVKKLNFIYNSWEQLLTLFKIFFGIKIVSRIFEERKHDFYKRYTYTCDQVTLLLAFKLKSDLILAKKFPIMKLKWNDWFSLFT